MRPTKPPLGNFWGNFHSNWWTISTISSNCYSFLFKAKVKWVSTIIAQPPDYLWLGTSFRCKILGALECGSRSSSRGFLFGGTSFKSPKTCSLTSHIPENFSWIDPDEEGKRNIKKLPNRSEPKRFIDFWVNLNTSSVRLVSVFLSTALRASRNERNEHNSERHFSQPKKNCYKSGHLVAPIKAAGNSRWRTSICLTN